MSSAGHIIDSINRMKANKGLTQRRDAFNLKEANYFQPKANRTYYRFNKADSAYLKNLRDRLATEKKQDLIKQIILLTLSILLGLTIFL